MGKKKKAQKAASHPQEKTSPAPEKQEKSQSIFYWIWSWPVISVAGAIFVGWAPSVMIGEPYIAEILFVVGIGLFLVKGLTWEIPRKHTKKKIIYFWMVFSALLIIVIFTVINYYQNRVPPQGSFISVSPASYTVHPGMDEEFKMKITNNHDYPLGFVQVKIKLDSGDLPLENILISPSGKPIDLKNFPKPYGDPLQYGSPKDALRVLFSNDDGHIRVSGLMCRQKEELFILFFIEDMGPRSTRSFPVLIQKYRCKSKSRLLFSIRGSCKDSLPIYTRSDIKGKEIRSLLPPEGHYEKCHEIKNN